MKSQILSTKQFEINIKFSVLQIGICGKGLKGGFKCEKRSDFEEIVNNVKKGIIRR